MIVVLCEGNTLTKFGEGPMHGMHVTHPQVIMRAGNIGTYFKSYIFAISNKRSAVNETSFCFLPVSTQPIFLPNLTKSRT